MERPRVSIVYCQIHRCVRAAQHVGGKTVVNKGKFDETQMSERKEDGITAPTDAMSRVNSLGAGDNSKSTLEKTLSPSLTTPRVISVYPANLGGVALKLRPLRLAGVAQLLGRKFRGPPR